MYKGIFCQLNIYFKINQLFGLFYTFDLSFKLPYLLNIFGIVGHMIDVETDHCFLNHIYITVSNRQSIGAVLTLKYIGLSK